MPPKHFKKTPQKPVPGARKPFVTWPIQPKDIASLVSQEQKQQQANLTEEEQLQELVDFVDGLRTEPGKAELIQGFEELISRLRANIERKRNGPH